VNPRNVSSEVVKVIERLSLPLAFRVIANNTTSLLHCLHRIQVLTVKVVVHDSRSTVCERSFLRGHGVIADAPRTLCLAHQERKSVRLW